MRRAAALALALALAACASADRPIDAPLRPPGAILRVPDVNGDGYADLVVGAPGERVGDIGRVYLYLGGPRGWPTTPSQILAAADDAGASFGSVLALADLDRDGFVDLAVAAPDAGDARGAVYVHTGGALGLSATAARVLRGSAAGDRFGAALAASGTDLVVGAPGAGHAFLFRATDAAPVATYAGDTAEPGRFGAAVAAAGDVNGDGFTDVAIGAPDAARLAGTVSVYTLASEHPSSPFQGATGQIEALGAHLAGVGDLDGDALADLVVAAPLAGHERGVVHVHLGARTGLSRTPSAVVDNPDGRDGDGARFGDTLAAAGDVDGDGLADFLVGAPRDHAWTGRLHFFRGGRQPPRTPSRSWSGPAGTYAAFGTAIAGGGDADGDGFPEILASAPGARVVFVYAGGAGGPSEDPARVLRAPIGASSGYGLALAVTR